MSEIAIADIDVSGRSRKSMGDIAALAASIETIGLLHPVVVTPQNKLIVGRRRIEAFKILGRVAIPARVAHTFGELHSMLEAERDENICRLDYEPEEAVHLGRKLIDVFRPEIDAAKSEGRSRGGGDRRSNEAKDRSGESCTKAKRDNSKRLVEKVGASVGMSGRTFERAAKVVDSGNRALIDEMNKTHKVSGVHKKLVVEEKSREIAKDPPPLPKGPFRVIVIDPPWQYDNRAEDVSHRSANPYPSMDEDAILDLPIPDLSHEDCVLWLWTTNAHIFNCRAIVSTWGFTYKTLLTWGKNKMGCGDWLRGKTEHCLMCVKGKPTIKLTDETTLLLADAGKHSAKPAEFYEMVEKLCPGSKLEMFQRTPRDGWIGHGDDAVTSPTIAASDA